MEILQKNAFNILNVTIRDNRQHIVEKAEEASLDLDHEVCQKSRSDLTNPRLRLTVEMTWLPGVSPTKAKDLLEKLYSQPFQLIAENGLPTLAHLNILSSAFEAITISDSIVRISSFIIKISKLVEEVSFDQVLRDINEDRGISGFPEVKSVQQVESIFVENKREYRNSIKSTLDKFPPPILVSIFTKVADISTKYGERHAHELVEQLVDSYQVDTQGFLEEEAKTIQILIDKIRDKAHQGESVVEPLIDKLSVVTRNWDMVAQPIQLVAKARGIDHDESNEVAYSVRSLGIDLFNKHDMLVQSQRLVELLQELFSELPELKEKVDEDSEALGEIFYNREHKEDKNEKWKQDIYFSAEIGIVFKDTLTISYEGVSWKKSRYALDDITRVRWGGIRQSINGIPTGTTYTIAFGNDQSETNLELNSANKYNGFIEKLWIAVCFRILTDILTHLKTGGNYTFGDLILYDNGVTLVNHKFFKNEKILLGWHQVLIQDGAGEFEVKSSTDKRIYSTLSYIETPNAHIVYKILHLFKKSTSARKLSDLLQ